MKDFTLSKPVTIMSGDSMFGGVQKPVQAQECAILGMQISGDVINVTVTPHGLYSKHIETKKNPTIAKIIDQLEMAVSAFISEELTK